MHRDRALWVTLAVLVLAVAAFLLHQRGPGGLPALEAPISNDKLERARLLAQENPIAVANIMRAWVNGEELETASPAGGRR